MDFSRLTDYQLYDIIQNNKLDATIRHLANKEFKSRNLSVDRVDEIIVSHDARFVPEKRASLNGWFKLSLILLPFVFPVNGIFSGNYLAKGEKKKWKEYWLFLCLGYLLWTGLVILFARYAYPNWG